MTGWQTNSLMFSGCLPSSVGMRQAREQHSDLRHGLGQLLHHSLPLLRRQGSARAVGALDEVRQRIRQSFGRPLLVEVERLSLLTAALVSHTSHQHSQKLFAVARIMNLSQALSSMPPFGEHINLHLQAYVPQVWQGHMSDAAGTARSRVTERAYREEI